MNLDNFIESLITRYKEPKNSEIINEIRMYFIDRRINFLLLRNIIMQSHKYESFPNLPTIKEYADMISGGDKVKAGDKFMEYLDYQKKVIDDSRTFSVEKIIKTIKAIRSAQDKRDLRTIEVSFLHFWSSLENFSGILKDKNHTENEIYRMCTDLKNRITSGNDDNSYRPEDELVGNRKGMNYAHEVF